jgi:hypothetical protein
MRSSILGLLLLSACAGNADVNMPGRGRPSDPQGEPPATQAPATVEPTVDASAPVSDAAPTQPDAASATPDTGRTPSVRLTFEYSQNGPNYVTFTAPSDYPADSQGVTVRWEGQRTKTSGCGENTTITTSRDDSNLSLASGEAGYCQPSTQCNLSFRLWCVGARASIIY